MRLSLLLPHAGADPRGRPAARSAVDCRASSSFGAAVRRDPHDARSSRGYESARPPDLRHAPDPRPPHRRAIDLRTRRRRAGRRSVPRARRLAALGPPGGRGAAAVGVRRRCETWTLCSTLAAAASAADCVVPLLHGETGEDGALREVLELVGVPYVGSRPAACRVAFDKPIAKQVVAEAGLATPPSSRCPHEIFRELGAAAVMEALDRAAGLPLMVKPARGGSALGCSMVDRPTSCPGDGGLLRLRSGRVGRAFVEGTEVTVAVVDRGDGPQALPAVEIRPDGGCTTTPPATRPGATQFLVPGAAGPRRGRSGCAERGPAGARGARAARPVADRPDDRRRRRPVVPRGERRARDDRDLRGPAGHRGSRLELGKMCADLARRATNRAG